MGRMTRTSGSASIELPSPRRRKKPISPPGMLGRWLAALLGGVASAIMVGIAIARSLEGAPEQAVQAGSFLAVCSWAVIAPWVIAQRSARKACGLVLGIFSVAALWAWSA